MSMEIPYDDFYVAFESRHRGSRDLIKSRLKIYDSFVDKVDNVYPHSRVVDLGCGRGEWLELMSEKGFDALGVDLDEGMLQSCHQLGLQTEKREAVSYLRTLADQSVAIVSGFHIVEHIPFDDLRDLVQEAHRVLFPGGLLIMETPNPENIIVSTRNFYLDPTHQRPIPPELLLFLPQYSGFFQTKILRLQEDRSLLNTESPSLSNILAGTSPDFAVIAQKAADDKITEAFTEDFKKEYGLTLDSLVARFDDQRVKNENRTQLAEIQAQAAEAQAQSAEARAQSAEARAQIAEIQAQAAEAQAQKAFELASHVQIIAHKAEDALSAIYASHSWQVTKPLRLVAHGLRWFLRGSIAWLTLAPGSRPRRVAAKIFLGLINFVLVSPGRKAFALKILTNFPRVVTRLRSLTHHGLVTEPVYPSTDNIDKLSTSADKIYQDLISEIERRTKDSC